MYACSGVPIYPHPSLAGSLRIDRSPDRKELPAMRSPISKKIRFEVFKRDSFTCQYCGSKAPDVVLHVDHIEPVKEGGTSDILNLVTACDSCNSGKGATRLSDESALKKSQKQAELLQARREQIEMIASWHRELVEHEYLASAKVAETIPFMKGYGISEYGVTRLTKWIKKFGLAEILEASRIAFSSYYHQTLETWDTAFNKIPAIARIRELEKSDPILAKAYLYRGILRSNLSYIDWKDVLEWLRILLDECGESKTSHICNSARSWTNFTEIANAAIQDARRLRA